MRGLRAGRLGIAAILIAAFVAAPAWPARAAGAAGTPSWRIAKIVSAVGQEYSVSASGPANAWATGDLKATEGSRLGVERWNGRAWQPIAVPSSLGFLPAADPFTPVGSSSAGEAWLFPQALTGSTPRSYALHWHDGRWTTTRLPKGAIIEDTAVFGADDAWAFGAAGTSSRLTPYDLRWNGKKLRTVALPGVPYEVSAISASDMWTAGRSRATLNQPANRQITLAMHWNGKAWSSVRVPVPRLPRGGTLDASIAATGPAGLWFAYIDFDGNLNFLSNGLLRWDDGKWHRLRLPAGFTDFLNSAVQDGHGGLWVTSGGENYHYSAGRWTRQALPKDTFCDALAWIPGTHAAWCSGSLSTAHGLDGVILRSPA